MNKLPKNLEKALRALWKANETSKKCHKEIALILVKMGIEQDSLRGDMSVKGFASEALTFFDYNEGGSLNDCLNGLLEDLNTLQRLLSDRK